MDDLDETLFVLPMFNSHGILDVILTGDGKDSRIFRTLNEVKWALKRAGILIVELEEQINGLEFGVTCEIPVSRLQKSRLYFPAEDNYVAGPIQ
jgi:hypothetical protein